MTYEILTAVLQFLVNKQKGLVVFVRMGKTRWICHPKHIASFSADNIGDCTTHGYFDAFYLIEHKLAKLTVKLI